MVRASFRRAGVFAPLLVLLACERFSDGTGGSGATNASTTDTSSGTPTTGTETSSTGTPTGSTGSLTSSTTTSGTGGGGPTMETVTVVDSAGAAVADARLVVNDAAGDVLLADEATDVNGQWTGDIPPGGSVTYIAPPDAENDLAVYAYLDAPQGGAIKFIRLHTDDVPSNPHPAVTYNVAAANPPGNATGYEVYASCKGQATTSATSMFSMSSYRGCPGNTKTSFLLVAYAAGDDAISFGLLGEQNLLASGTTSISISLGDTNFIERTWDVVNPPFDATSYLFKVTGFDVSFGSLADSPLLELRRNPTMNGASFTNTAQIPNVIEKGWLREQMTVAPDNPYVVRMRNVPLANLNDPIGNWTPTTPTTAGTTDLFDFVDPTHVRVAFDVPQSPPPSDALVMILKQPIDASIDRQVTLFAPATTASRVIPLLPADVEAAYPVAAGIEVQYLHIDYTALDGYAASAADGMRLDDWVGFSADSQLYTYTP